MANPGEERDIRNAPCKATNGAYGIPTAEQNGRMYELGRLVQLHRAELEQVMKPDPHIAKDDRGTPYWGSKRHVIDSALFYLEREIENVLRKTAKRTDEAK